MSGKVQIPVVGVFWSEVDHLDGWLASVNAQNCDELEPLPVIVVSLHPAHVSELDEKLTQYVAAGRIQRENIRILNWNVGPTVGFNIGAKQFIAADRKCPWIASLDPDARFAPNALRQLFLTGNEDLHIGMVSPLIIKPRMNHDFQQQVVATETVCQAGHFPFQRIHLSPVLTNYWKCHFQGWKLVDVQTYLIDNPLYAPFAACFCSSLWRSQMFNEIELPDDRQFRTLNCGEIGYRAQLKGWTGRFCSQAIAFHESGTGFEKAGNAMVDIGGGAWQYYHAQGLISKKYFPDEYRDRAAKQGDEYFPWDFFFRDLNNVDSYGENETRLDVFNRWREFDLKRQ